jgi:hypothetical protein
MYIEVYLDKRISIPGDFDQNPDSCLGFRGTDRLKLACKADRKAHKITLTDLFESKQIKPDVVEILF